MCSAPIVRTAVRAATAVSTFGTSEALRASGGAVGATANKAGYAVDTLLAGNKSPGYVAPVNALDAKTGAANFLPGPPGGDVRFGGAPPPTDVTPPTPGAPAPGTTTVDSILAKRRKKLSTLQSGLLSTIATSGGGIPGVAPTLSPTAGGGSAKTLLGT